MLIFRITSQHLDKYNCNKCWEIVELLHPGYFYEGDEVQICMNFAKPSEIWEISSKTWEADMREHTCPLSLQWLFNEENKILFNWVNMWERS